MRIVVTGGGGFLGRMLAAAMVARGGLALGSGAAAPLTALALLDRTFSANRIEDDRVSYVDGDIADPDFAARALAPGADAVFHLAAAVSAEAELDFDLGMRVNIDGTRCMLEACRGLTRPPRFVLTSSVAAFGGDLPDVVSDSTAATPQSSYGTQKVIGELLVADYSRKGFIDGRSVRLPTIVVRPGKPNRAASGFMSSILREPLAGLPAICPVPPETKMWILSPQRAVDTLIHAMELSANSLGWNRTLNAPGVTVSVAEALNALERMAGPETAALVRFQRDQDIEKIVMSWPAQFRTARADELGFKADSGIDEVIRAHRRTLRQ